MVDWIVKIVDGLGYVGIALLMLLENLFPPIPSELIMPLSGFVVTQGELDFVSVVIAGVIGSVLGALPWYYLGKSLSLKRIKGLADRYGRWLTLSSQEIERAKDWFERRGEMATCVSRLVPGVRTYISVPAGLSKMALLPFLFYSTLGTAIWVSLLTTAGYVLGANYDRVKDFVGSFSIVVAIVIVVVSVGWVIRRKRRT